MKKAYFCRKFSFMQEMILILDFGSQVTQLIGRRLRELNVYCEIHPFNKVPSIGSNVKGVILSGSPFSVRDEHAPIAVRHLLWRPVYLASFRWRSQW